MTLVGLVSHWSSQWHWVSTIDDIGRFGLLLFPEHLVVVNLLHSSCRQQKLFLNVWVFWGKETFLVGSGFTSWEIITWAPPQHLFHILSTLPGQSHQHLKSVWSTIPWYCTMNYGLANIDLVTFYFSTFSKSPQSSRASCVWEPPSLLENGFVRMIFYYHKWRFTSRSRGYYNIAPTLNNA